MKIPGIFKSKAAEELLLAILVVVTLLIPSFLPLGQYGGGVAMMAGSVVGLIAYFILFGERLHVCPGAMRRVIATAVVGVAVAASLAIWLMRAHWR